MQNLFIKKNKSKYLKNENIVIFKKYLIKQKRNY